MQIQAQPQAQATDAMWTIKSITRELQRKKHNNNVLIITRNKHKE